MLEYIRPLLFFIGISSVVWTSDSVCVYDTPDGNITSLTKDNLPPDLSHLMLSRHPLANISDDVFDNFANTLYYLTIQGVQFKQLPRSLFKLSALISLIITDTPIENWESFNPEILGLKLNQLTLVNVGLTVWPSWISNFHLLYNLDLTGNALNSVASNAFHSSNQSLINLFLGYAGLTQDASWTPPEELTNNISSYDYDYDGMVDLSSLPVDVGDTEQWDLYKTLLILNKLIYFSNSSHLSSINLDNNNISDYADGSLPPFVMSLSLTGNHLSSVPEAVARSYYLDFLNVSRNEISEINSFSSKITTLDLSFNKLSVITNTSFSKLNNLKSLYLNDNPISSISTSAFSKLKLLTFLSIDSTNLTEFPLAVARIVYRPLVVKMYAIGLTCNCSHSTEIYTWYNRGKKITVTGLCTDGRAISEYLLTKCDLQTATITPTANATAGRATKPTDNAPDGDATTLADNAPDGDSTTLPDNAPDGDSTTQVDTAPDGDSTTQVDTVPDGDSTTPTFSVHAGGLTTREHAAPVDDVETATGYEPDNDALTPARLSSDDSATTPKGHAPALKGSLFCRHGTLLLIIVLWIHGY